MEEDNRSFIGYVGDGDFPPGYFKVDEELAKYYDDLIANCHKRITALVNQTPRDKKQEDGSYIPWEEWSEVALNEHLYELESAIYSRYRVQAALDVLDHEREALDKMMEDNAI